MIDFFVVVVFMGSSSFVLFVTAAEVDKVNQSKKYYQVPISQSIDQSIDQSRLFVSNKPTKKIQENVHHGHSSSSNFDMIISSPTSGNMLTIYRLPYR